MNETTIKALDARIEALEQALLNFAFEQNVRIGQPITRFDLKRFLKAERVIEE